MSAILEYLLFVLATYLVFYPVERFARNLGVLDYPNHPRKRHKTPVTSWGGLAIMISLNVAVLLTGLIDPTQLMIVNGFGLVGLVDDWKGIDGRVKLVLLVLLSAMLVTTGIRIDSVSNPFSPGLLAFGGVTAIIISIAWLVSIPVIFNFLDGVDGLVSGMSVLSGIFIAAISSMTLVNQPDLARFGLMISATAFGFWLVNRPPAKAFLGDGGSYFLGILFAVLAIISGTKIATALLIFTLPILDSLIVIIRRLLNGQSPFRADRSHLHFVLLDRGWNTWQVLGLYYGLTTIFGLIAIYATTLLKLVILLLAGLLSVVIMIRLVDNIVIKR
ncbi:undecaprenyl/decaprenyl-phosphate alpha-N-acetylglucosaminyl 1-phosphate transferase [Candidatus Saccharibacteria bacterium]|nr:undecaprenyl/decaprenyl-phosphate alpha-N-acetylglucosaminyl 1-phosphate transferase [Candidatus Saccharibacteria bacterium]MCB9834633.1 undecaprenyl/decaprenyl-phosphate alpha-N-acetylglucosaminyl 1-phosphate transferase [Candidatus Nomurabacteria bacterium]